MCRNSVSKSNICNNIKDCHIVFHKQVDRKCALYRSQRGTISNNNCRYMDSRQQIYNIQLHTSSLPPEPNNIILCACAHAHTNEGRFMPSLSPTPLSSPNNNRHHSPVLHSSSYYRHYSNSRPHCHSPPHSYPL